MMTRWRRERMVRMVEVRKRIALRMLDGNRLKVLSR